MTALPAMVTSQGEIVHVLTAEHLLQAAGLTDLREADVEQLAAFTDHLDHFARVGREAKTLVSDELIRRLDKRGKWTLREAGFTIRAASPLAGGVSYDTAALVRVLGDLLADDQIEPEASYAAVELVQPEPYYKQRASGINALLKLGGKVAEAIRACQVETEPPKRTAKVTRERSR